MGVFDKTVVFALNKKSPPSAAILFSFANLRLPGNFTGGLREVKTSRNLPGKLPGKLTGSKITGVSRNTRKVYGSLTGDLPGPIIYRVFLFMIANIYAFSVHILKSEAVFPDILW